MGSTIQQRELLRRGLWVVRRPLQVDVQDGVVEDRQVGRPPLLRPWGDEVVHVQVYYLPATFTPGDDAAV